MDFNEYQKKALETAIYPKEKALEYCTLGLVSEAGEVAGKIKKIIRDKNGVLSVPDKDAIMAEISDVFWYCATLLDALDYSMDEAAEYNIAKLASRKERGVIGGSGDNR
jgi:NTP pyrophosphatase (non-canonical NTP hydrolase)